jgi:hypothetical protein
MEVPALRSDLNHSYGLDLPEAASIEMLETVLAEKIDALINSNFNALVQLLYRIDVSEQGLRQLLEENPATGAGQLISSLILERQWQKILTRRMYNNSRKDGPEAGEEERW